MTLSQTILLLFRDSPELNALKTRRRSYGNLRRNLRQFFQFYPRLAKAMKR